MVPIEKKKKKKSGSLLIPTTMIMSVHEPLSRKRALGSDSVLDVKRHCPDIDHPEAFSDTMYTVLVKSALENLEKVCFQLICYSCSLPPL